MSKIDKETAIAEFDRFKSAMRLRLDREGMDENDRRDVRDDIEILIGEIMEGRLVIDDEGRPVYQLYEGEALTFKRPKGGSIAVIDRKKEAHKIAQLQAIIGELCGKPVSFIQAMDWADIDICAIIVGLFFVR